MNLLYLWVSGCWEVYYVSSGEVRPASGDSAENSPRRICHVDHCFRKRRRRNSGAIISGYVRAYDNIANFLPRAVSLQLHLILSTSTKLSQDEGIHRRTHCCTMRHPQGVQPGMCHLRHLRALSCPAYPQGTAGRTQRARVRYNRRLASVCRNVLRFCGAEVPAQ